MLAGRAATAPAGLRSPLLGLVLLGRRRRRAAYGARAPAAASSSSPASAILAVLGMILLVPLVLAGLARVSGGCR